MTGIARWPADMEFWERLGSFRLSCPRAVFLFYRMMPLCFFLGVGGDVLTHESICCQFLKCLLNIFRNVKNSSKNCRACACLDILCSPKSFHEKPDIFQFYVICKKITFGAEKAFHEAHFCLFTYETKKCQFSRNLACPHRTLLRCTPIDFCSRIFWYFKILFRVARARAYARICRIEFPLFPSL